MFSKNDFPQSFLEKNWFFRFPNLKGLNFGDTEKTSHKINISCMKISINNNDNPSFIRFSTFFRKFDGLDANEKSINFFVKKVTSNKKNKIFKINNFIEYFHEFKNFIKILKKAFLKLFIFRFNFKNAIQIKKSESKKLNIIRDEMNGKRRLFIKKNSTLKKNLGKIFLKNLFSKKILALKMRSMMNLSYKKKVNKEKYKFIKKKRKIINHKSNLNSTIISRTNLNILKRKSILPANKICFPISNKLDKIINQRKKSISGVSSKNKFLGMKINYFFFVKKLSPNNFSRLKFNRNILLIHIEKNKNKKQILEIFFKKKCLKSFKKILKNRKFRKMIHIKKLKYLVLVENSKKQPVIDLDCPFSFLVCISNKNILFNKINGILITKKIFQENSHSHKNIDKKLNNAKFFVKNLIINIKSIEIFEKKIFEYQDDEFFLILKNTNFFYDITFKNFKKYVKYLREDILILNLLKNKNSKSRTKLMTLKKPTEEFTFLKKSKFLSEIIIKFFNWKNPDETTHDFLNLLENPKKVNIILKLKKFSRFKKPGNKKKMKDENKIFYPKKHIKIISILKECLKKKKKELKNENLKKKSLIGKFFHLPFKLKFNLKKYDKLEKTIRELETVSSFLKNFNENKTKTYSNENFNNNNIMNNTILNLIESSPKKKSTKRLPCLTKKYELIFRIGYCIEFVQKHSVFFLSQNRIFSDIIQEKTEIKPENKECKIFICPEQNSTKQLLNFKNNIKLEKLIKKIGEFKKKSPIFDFCKYKKKHFHEKDCLDNLIIYKKELNVIKLSKISFCKQN